MVYSSVLMKAEKVAAIVGQQDPALSHRERQNVGIRHGGIRLSGIQRGKDVMPQLPQFPDYLQWDIFIRIEMGHSLCSLVLANLGLDFPGMRPRVGPGVHQILGTQLGVGSQQSLFASAQTPGLLEKPNGNPGSHDARLAAAHIRARVDAWEITIQLPSNPFENLRLLPPRQSRKHFLEITQVRHPIPLFIVADTYGAMDKGCHTLLTNPWERASGGASGQGGE